MVQQRLCISQNKKGDRFESKKVEDKSNATLRKSTSVSRSSRREIYRQRGHPDIVHFQPVNLLGQKRSNVNITWSNSVVTYRRIINVIGLKAKK
jgi:hypothetical protein